MKKLFVLIAAVACLVGCASAQKKSPSTPSPIIITGAKQDGAANVSVSEQSKQSSSGITCQLNSETRKLEIQMKSAGCELTYTKLGKSKVVASSHKGKTHCEESLATIRKKLVASGFKCQ